MTTYSTSNSNLYQIYTNSIVALAQSIVIKSDAVAIAINSLVLQNTGVAVTSSDRTTWKYYQNICGLYNSADTPMVVYSLDSETQISFDKATILENPVTAAAYKYGSTFYNELLAAYPDQEMLILGILYPADMTTAVSCDDGTILAYPTGLVEAEEISLIGNLQSWIYAYLNRWVINGFCLTDNLYLAAYMGQLYLHLIPVITNLRLAKCKTNEVHSFHLNQYLKSHGFLDQYLKQMTRTQVLNMYRNINYYERYAGFQSTFASLVDVLLTKANLPAYEYVLQHDTQAISHSAVTDTTNILPTALFRRIPINSIAKIVSASDYNLVDAQAQLYSATPSNEGYLLLNQATTEHRLDTSIRSVLPTKVIECGLNDVIAPLPTSLVDILMNTWIQVVATDRYAVPVEYTPVGASAPVRLSHQQAMALWIYAFCKASTPANVALGYPTLTRVPTIRANKVLIPNIPNKAYLLSLVDQKYVDQSLISLLLTTAVTLPTTVDSLMQFTALANQIYGAQIDQYNLYSFQNNPNARAMLSIAANSLYADTTYTLGSLQDGTNGGMLYSDLLLQVGLDLSNYSHADYNNMAMTLFNYATNADVSTLTNQSTIQAAMVSLLSYLSAYSTQVVSTGRNIATMVVPRPDIRTYNYQNQETITGCNVDITIGALSENVIESIVHEYVLNPVAIIAGSTLSESENINVVQSSTVAYINNSDMTGNSNIYLDTAYSVDMQASFNSLTLVQKQAVVDTYRIAQ